MDASIGVLANQLFEQVRTRLTGSGNAWASLGPEGQAIVEGVVQDAAALQVRAMGIPKDDAPGQQAAMREKAHLNAQLANLEAAAAVNVSAVVWDVVQQAVQGAVVIAFAAL